MSAMIDDDPPPFRVSVKEIPRPSGWSYTRVTILDDQGQEMGGYERNYGRFGDSTFRPFFLHGRWWALYSKDYTATRVMILPECQDWCGEESNSFGFCPVDYYVPRYRTAKLKTVEGEADWCIGEGAWGWDNPEQTRYVDIAPTQYCPFGLVAGCIWGDDTSWKVEWLDLGGLPERKFKREPRFGYVELLQDRNLKDSVDLAGWAPDCPDVGIIGKRWQNCETGVSEFPVNT